MFDNCEIPVPKKEIIKIFNAIDYDGSKRVSKDELKKFVTSKDNKEKFREIMRIVRKKTKETLRNSYASKRLLNLSFYIPLTFESLLNFLYEKSHRNQIC